MDSKNRILNITLRRTPRRVELKEKTKAYAWLQGKTLTEWLDEQMVRYTAEMHKIERFRRIVEPDDHTNDSPLGRGL